SGGPGHLMADELPDRDEVEGRIDIRDLYQRVQSGNVDEIRERSIEIELLVRGIVDTEYTGSRVATGHLHRGKVRIELADTVETKLVKGRDRLVGRLGPRVCMAEHQPRAACYGKLRTPEAVQLHQAHDIVIES